MIQFASLSVSSAPSWIYHLIVSLRMKQFWRNLLSPYNPASWKEKAISALLTEPCQKPCTPLYPPPIACSVPLWKVVTYQSQSDGPCWHHKAEFYITSTRKRHVTGLCNFLMQRSPTILSSELKLLFELKYYLYCFTKKKKKKKSIATC